MEDSIAPGPAPDVRSFAFVTGSRARGTRPRRWQPGRVGAPDHEPVEPRRAHRHEALALTPGETATDGFEIVAQGLNQTLVRVGDDDAATAATLAAVQADGTCWPSGTAWRARGCIRLSVCNWQTTALDVDRSVDALARAARDALAVRV